MNKKTVMKWTRVGVLAFLPCFAVGSVSASEKGETDHFDYPELMVVPRASDRLQSEANKEAGSRLTNYLPVQLSSLTTFLAGALYNDPLQPYPSYVGMGIGGVFFLTTTAMSFFYEPYEVASRAASAMPKGTVREQLARERFSEEEIEKISDIGQRIRWLSFVGNLAASAVLLGRNASGQESIGFPIASLILSATPLIFDFHSHDVYQEQRDYKKRIYGPVATPTLLPDPGTQKVTPGLLFALSF